MRRQIILVAGVVAIAVVAVSLILFLGGGVGDGSPDPGTGDTNTSNGTGTGALDATGIRDRSVRAMRNVSTANYEMNLTLETGSSTTELQSLGALDVVNETLRVETELRTVSGETTRTLDVRRYGTADTAYTKLRDDWRTEALGWNSTPQIGAQLDFLTAVSVQRDGTATVGDVETYVLVLGTNNSTDALRTFLVNQIAQQGIPLGQADRVIDAVNVTDVRAKAFVARDSFRLRRIDMTVTFQQKVAGKGTLETGELSLTITYTGFNDSVSITVPEEAKRSLVRGRPPA